MQRSLTVLCILLRSVCLHTHVPIPVVVVPVSFCRSPSASAKFVCSSIYIIYPAPPAPLLSEAVSHRARAGTRRRTRPFRPFDHLVKQLSRLFDHLVKPFDRLFNHLVKPYDRLFDHLVKPYDCLFDHLVKPSGRRRRRRRPSHRSRAGTHRRSRPRTAGRRATCRRLR